MEERKNHDQYAMDILSAMAERTIKRLCIIIAILVIMFGTAMTLWMVERSQWEAIETSYEIEQETNDGGDNYAIGRDFYGSPENQG